MALTSRLAIEVDGRTAEQQVVAIRKALEALEQAGLRVAPSMQAMAAALAAAGKNAQDAATKTQNAKKQIDDLGEAGKKSSSALNGAAGGLNGMGSSAAAAEAKILAARRAIDALNESSKRTGSTIGGAGGAINSAGNGARAATTQVQGLERQVKSLAVMAAGLAGPLAAAFSVKSFYDAAEAYTALTSRMKLVTNGAGELAEAQSAVFSAAQSAFQPLTATAELYQRIATNQKELGLTGKEVAGVVGTISKSLAISGASASAANAALVQLGQAFASGVLRGEELNSVMEQAPALAQAIARGMGKTVGELRALGAEGKLTADAVVKALQSQQGAVEELFGKTAVTVGNSFTAMGNSFTQLVGRLDQASGTTAAIAGSIVSMSQSMDGLTEDSLAVAKTLEAVGAAMTGVAAGGAVLLTSKLGTLAYSYLATRTASITAAEATLNSARADAIKAASATAAAKADMDVYRGTILQTVASGRYAEARLIEAGADSRAAAAKNALAAASSRTAAAMALVGGPLGLATLAVGALAATVFLMGNNTDDATKSLDQHGLSLDQVTAKFDALNAAQKRVKLLDWADERAENLQKAAKALQDYADAEKVIGLDDDLGQQFRKFIEEVRAGKRDLDSVTGWLKEAEQITPEVERALSKMAAEYDSVTKRNKDLSSILGMVDKGQQAVTSSANTMAAAQGESSKQTKAQTAEIDKYLAKLREQVTLYGASKQKIAEYEASKLNMNAQQREEAKILGQIQDVQEKYREALKKNDAARKESLRLELEALITQRNAAQDAAQKSVDAISRIHWASDKALGESVNRRITELSRLATFASSLPGNVNYLTGEGIKRPTIQGASMVPIGAPTPQNTPATAVARKTAKAEAAELVAQINETSEARTKAAKAYTESAGQKMLNQASEQAAVLREQSLIYDKQVGQIEKIGPEQQKLIKWEQELADIKSKQTLTADQKSLLANQEQITAALKANAAEEKRIQTKERLYELDKKSAEMLKNINAELALSQQELNNDLAGVGLGQEGRRRLQEDLKIRQDHQKKVNDLQDQLNKGEIDKATYDKQTGYLKDALDQRLQMQQDYYRQLEIQQGDWTNGANAAWQDYVDSARDVAGQTYDLFSNAFSGMEDALVEFVMTGKLNFKEFANSIIADIARIIIRTQVVAPLLNSVFGGGGGITAGGGGIGAMFSDGSGGGGMSVTSMISGAKTVVEVASSKFVDSVVKGWATGGDSVVNSITGAFEGGASYVSSAITNAFSTGSQTATTIIADGVSISAGNGGAAMVDLTTNTVTNAAGEVVGNASAMTTQNAMGSALGQISIVLSYIQGVYSIFTSFKEYGLKGAAVTGGMAAAGAYIGSFFGPLGTAAGFAIGAALGAIGADKWFGTGEKYTELASSGSGTYSNGSFTDRGWVEGWKDGTTRFGTEADRTLTGYAQQFSTTLGMLYDTLGNGADVATDLTMRRRRTSGNYSSTFETTLDNGLSISHLAEYGGEIETRLNEFYDDYMGTFLAKAIVGSESLPQYFRAQFSKYADDWDVTAETVIAAIEGVFTRFEGVNSALNQVRVKTVELGETGLIASDSILNMVAKLADLDVDSATAKDKVKALQDLVNGYYTAFFTADEQFADLSKNLSASFGAFGLQIPDNREAYRSMVEDIDVTTAAGQAMFATFMGLATNADAYYKGVSDRTQAVFDAAVGRADVAFATLQRSINAQKTSINDMISTARDSASDLTSISNALGNAMKALRGDSDDAVKMLRAQAKATVASALAIAKAGGSLGNFEGLEDALSVISDNDTSLYGSLEDFNREQGRNANLVSELNDLTGKQLTASEKTIRALEDQLKGLDEQLLFAQSQLDALNGVDNSVKSVAQAIADMNAAVVAAIATISGKSTPANAGVLIDSIYKDQLGRDADAEGKQYWADQLASGALNNQNIVGAITNAAAIEAAYKAAGIAMNEGASYWAGQLNSGALTAAQLQEAVRNAAIANGSIPAFAAGGMHSGGIRLVGESGPELEVTGPARIFNANQTAAMLGGGDGWKEVLAAIQVLQQYAYQTTKNTGSTVLELRQQNEAGVIIQGAAA